MRLERERDLAEPARPVGIEALRLGERPREQLSRSDREQRREQRQRRRRHRQRSSSAAAISWAPVRSRSSVAPAARARAPPRARRAGSRRPRRSSRRGTSRRARRAGPWMRSVAVSGSAATRHVSSSFSEISRAVANSVPAADHEHAPDERERDARSRPAAARAPAGASSSRAATCADAVADQLALPGGVAREERERGNLVRVGLRRRDRALLAGRERQNDARRPRREPSRARS